VGTQRFADMIASLKYLDADIVCLQEVWCLSVRQKIHEEFSNYNFVESDSRNIIDCLLAVLYIASVSGLIFYIFELILYILWRPVLLTFSTVTSYYFLKETALYAWLAGDDTGLLVMIKKTFTICTVLQKPFDSQKGDWMNIVARRGFQLLTVERYQKIFSIINAHLNALGSIVDRCEQVRELVKIATNTLSFSSGLVICLDLNENDDSLSYDIILQEVKDLTDALALQHVSKHDAPRTWSNKNPRTKAWMQVSDLRCDFIFTTFKVLESFLIMDSHPWPSDHFGIIAYIVI
jgi:endonuclease/exonuclease/phosphatase family metal-dependent hydrolase